MADQLKLQIQATINQMATQKEIQSKITAIQKGVKLEIGVTPDTKTINKVLKNELNEIGKNNKLKLQADFKSFIKENDKIKQSTAEIKRLKTAINNINDQASLKKVRSEVNKFKSDMAAAGVTGRSFASETLKNLGKVTNWLGLTTVVFMAISGVKDIFSSVVDLDHAMTNLMKVTNETSATYERFVDSAAASAKRLGTTLVDIVESTSEFAKLGYTLSQAQTLAETASVYSMVGDMPIEIATGSLISTMKAFNIEAENSIEIIDRFNNIGNKYAISSEGIGEALRRSAASLMDAGNTIDQSISLITSANQVIQDPESVGTALKTVAMRIRGARIELESAGEDVDGMAESTAKLQEQLLALTGNKVDIMLDEDTFKSTYQIMLEMSKVWDSMTDINRASALELIAGKRQGNIISSMLENYATAENVLKDSMNSTGSAMQEHEKIIDSINGRMQILKATFQDFSQKTVNSEFIKSVVSLGTNILEIINQIGFWNVALITLMGILGGKTVLGLNAFAMGIQALIVKMTGGAVAATTLSMALSTIIPVALIMAGVWAIDKLTTSLSEQAEIVSNLTSEIQALNTEYDTLKSKAFLTGEEQKRLQLLERELEIKEKLLEVEKKTQANMILNNLTGGVGVDQFGIDNTGVSTELQRTNYQLKEYKKIQEEILETQKKANSVNGTIEDFQKIDELNGKLATSESAFLDLYNSLEPVINSGQKLNPEITKLIQSLEEVLGLTNDYSDVITELTEKQVLLTTVSNKVNDSQAITIDEKEQLLQLYPELQDSIYQTADGWTVEKEALDLVSNGVNNLRIAYTDAQNQMDIILESSVAKRLGILASELSAISSVAEAYALFAGKGGGVGLTEKEKRMGLFLSPEESELKNRLESLGLVQNKIAELQNEFNKIGSNPSGGKKPSSSSKSSKSDDPIIKAFEEQYKTLKYNLDKSLITEEQFYKSVEALNNKYYKGKSKYLDEYRKYEIEVLQGLQKYYEEYYQTQLKLAKEALEARQKSLSEEKTAYEGALAAVVSRIDKEIDSLNKEKEALQETNDEKERAIELEQLRENLARAKEQRTKRVFKEGIGFVWEADQAAISEAEQALNDFEADENIREIDKQIKKWEEYKQKWQDTVESYNDEQNDLYAIQVLGAKWESNILDQRTNRLEAFKDDYIRIMKEMAAVEADIANIDTSSGSKTVKVGSDGNAPSGTKVGDTVVVNNGKNAYKVVEAGTSGASYNPSSGLWSKKIYAKGGVADFTGMAQLDGSPTKAETIFNSDSSKKLYDLIFTTPTGDIASRIFGNLVKPMTNIPLSPATSGGLQLSMGEIHVHGVNDPNGLADAIINQFPNTFIQKLYKR